MAWRSRGHRGDALEELILLTNDYYRRHGYARVDKFPTPISASKINEYGQIILGYFEEKSTVDFVGAVQGVPICFDAKETSLKNLPLSNIHSHQVECMKDYRSQGGISFLIVHFKVYDTYFLVPLEMLEQYIENSKRGGRKSIPYSAMDPSYEISLLQGRILNYLPLINLYLHST